MNITVDRKVIEQALETLKKVKTDAGKQAPVYPWDAWRLWVDDSITALRTALEQPEQEQCPHGSDAACKECYQLEPYPVAWMLKSGHGTEFNECIADELKALTWKGKPMWVPLYDAPPQRKPLSDKEILTYRYMIDWTAEWSYINFARAIEAAHGIREPT